MNHDEITSQIMSVWDDEAGDVVPDAEAVADGKPDSTPVDNEEPVSGELEETEADEEKEAEEEPAEEPVEEEEEPAEEPEGEPEEEEVPEPVGFQTDDPEVQAFLSKYGGDLEKALKAEAQQQRVIGRQGSELDALRRQVTEMTSELERLNALSQTPSYLTAEQQGWLEQVMEQGDPRQAVRAAVDAQEFDLARAVCEAWSQESPYEAARIAAQVDQIEQRVRQHEVASVEPQQLDYPALLEVLTSHYPEMPQFSQRMTELVATLGDNHMLVQDSRSNDPETAARGIIGLYEIARASTATVKQTRERVRRQQQEDADTARANGVVSTATATPASTETPRRQRRLTPGLTMEDFDAAFNEASQ